MSRSSPSFCSEPLHPLDPWLARVEFALRYGIINAKRVLAEAPGFVAEYALKAEVVRGKRKTLMAWLQRRAQNVTTQTPT